MLKFFNTDPVAGLTDAAAATARVRHGPNELPPEAVDPLWRRVARQFDDLLVKILVGAAVVDLVLAWANGETGPSALVEPGVIVAVLAANAAVGVLTEANAERALAELRAYEAEGAAVWRGGVLSTVPAAALVPGDLVSIAVGARVPADVRLIAVDGGEVRADQSVLTGESDSVPKTVDALPRARPGAAPLVAQDKANTLFAGTVVTAGRGRGVVIATGGRTAMGAVRAAVAAARRDEPTPLKQKLDDFGDVLSRIIAGVCVAVWVVNIPRFGDARHGGRIQGEGEGGAAARGARRRKKDAHPPAPNPLPSLRRRLLL